MTEGDSEEDYPDCYCEMCCPRYCADCGQDIYDDTCWECENREEDFRSMDPNT